MQNSKEHFFCYDLNLSDYLRREKGIDFITIAMNIKTKRIFTLFKRNQYLSKCIDEYNTLIKQP